MYLETRISEGNRFADLYFRGKGSFSGIIFRVKAEKLADDEPKEYTAEQDEYGRWYARVDLLDFSADGLYNVEVCSTRSSTPLTERSFSLSYIPAMDYTRYGINYRAVFNPVYYMERYPDVAAVCHSDPRVLLCDEATSALDNETQATIRDAIENMHGKRTVVMVAHRLSTVVNCERLFYIDNGRVLASGTHAELLESCPEYRRLYAEEAGAC